MSRELITEYSNAVREFQGLVKATSPGDILKTPIAGEWSIGYVIHHMADGEVQFATRFMNALAEKSPKIFTFDEEVYPGSLQYEKRDVNVSLNTVAAIGSYITNLLENINSDDWNRSSIHPELGEMTITDILLKITSHYQAHIGQIKEIQKSL